MRTFLAHNAIMFESTTDSLTLTAEKKVILLLCLSLSARRLLAQRCHWSEALGECEKWRQEKDELNFRLN